MEIIIGLSIPESTYERVADDDNGKLVSQKGSNIIV